MRIHSENITLRPWRDTDAEALYLLARDPDIGNAAGWPPHTSVEMSREVIRTYFSQPDTYAVVLSQDTADTPIGCIGLVPAGMEHYPGIDSPSQREVGYWIGKAYWGNGFIPEALCALIKALRSDRHDITSLWIVTYADNLKSQRVAAKCGFALAHTFTDPDIRESKAFIFHLSAGTE